MAETMKLTVETGAVTVEVEDEHGRAMGSFEFNPADSNIFKRYGAVVDFFNSVTLEDGGTEEQQMERMNALADDIGGQFDYLLNGNVAAGIFEKCGPLTVTKNGDFFFEQVLEGIGALIEKTTKQRLEKKLAKARRAAGNAPSVRARK